MRHTPTVEDYARMTDAVRRQAVDLIREEREALAVARERAAARRVRARLEGSEVADLTLAAARRLVWVYVRRHGDTPELQAARRAVHESRRRAA